MGNGWNMKHETHDQSHCDTFFCYTDVFNHFKVSDACGTNNTMRQYGRDMTCQYEYDYFDKCGSYVVDEVVRMLQYSRTELQCVTMTVMTRSLLSCQMRGMMS